MTVFNTTTDYVLENDIVLLRPLLISDFEHLLPFATDQPEIWKYSLVSAAGNDGMKNYIKTALFEKEKGLEYPFIVFDKRTNQYAGSTRFYDIQIHNKSMQLGYTWYAKEFQGTGLNKNCKLLLLQFAFETLGLERVEFRADNNNEKSKAAMRSIGCVEEGVLRSHLSTYTGLRRDSIILSILKEDWYSGVRNKLIEKINKM